ncbi:bestrophin-like domain [Algisphaera agarilytica]|uniref:DUF4239 domain-containing protein n=1 Tax=Algisphaera agarilytica TaxID=1385975 RepID=A0A7X0LMB9_9BACT|nr:hypothetical protein [Algisphaera agarilytica]MBB6430863.1 hypothetical protein [Algisphaera agarilytica]
MPNLLLTNLLFIIGLYALLELGGWLARNASSSDAPPASGVVFAVFGLIIAFTFTTSAQRFDERRELIVHHANAFGTAWDRLDILPEEDREAVRAPMREWIGLIDRPVQGPIQEHLVAIESEALSLQQEAWDNAVAAVKRTDQPALTVFILAPLNEWSDLTTLRRTRGDVGLPPMVLGTLIGLSLLVALVAGYAMTKRGNPLLLHKLAFTIAIGILLHVIVDLNAPREGLIRVDRADRILFELYEQNKIPAESAEAKAPPDAD